MDFTAAAEAAKQLKNNPGNDKKLQLYGLFKQATVGDNNSSQPWAVQIEKRAKWDAWEANKGKTKQQAEEAYVKLVQELQEWDSKQ